MVRIINLPSSVAVSADDYIVLYDNAGDITGKASLTQAVAAGAASLGAGDMILAGVQTNTGAKTFNSATLLLAGATSGSTTLNSGAIAGASVLTLPVATDTLVGKATTDTLTNKTFDTAGSGNVFKINTVSVTDKTGTGKMVLDTTPTLVTPVLGVATATSINGLTITTSTGVLTITNAKTLAVTQSLTLSGTDSTTMTFPTTSATLARTDAANTFTGHQTIEGVTSTGATGSGKLVFDTSPTLVTPILGTPTSGTLTNATGLPVAGITASTVTALGVGSVELGHASDTTLSRASAGVLAVEGVNVLLNGGALGTPSSGTLTNATGLPVAGITASTVTALGVGSIELGHATDTSITRVSAGVAAVEGKNIALNGTGETLTTGTIELGAASDTTIARSGAGAITVEGVQVALNSTSLVHTASTIELGAASDTTLSRSSAGVLAVEGVVIPSISSTNTLTNKRITPRVNTVASSATPTINTDTTDIFTITALAAAITSMTTNLSGTPSGGDKLQIRIKDNATPRTIAWGTSFASSGVATLLATTATSKTHWVQLEYDDVTAKWVCMAVDATGY